MFQSSTVRPHPHCFGAVHISWAISCQLHNRDLRISRTSYECLDMLARLAHELSARQMGGFTTSEIGRYSFEHISHTIVRPLSSLYRLTALIVSFVFLLFWAVWRTDPDSLLGIHRGLRRRLGSASGFVCPDQDRKCSSGGPSSDGCPEMPIAAPQVGAQQRWCSPHSYLWAAQ